MSAHLCSEFLASSEGTERLQKDLAQKAASSDEDPSEESILSNDGETLVDLTHGDLNLSLR